MATKQELIEFSRYHMTSADIAINIALDPKGWGFEDEQIAVEEALRTLKHYIGWSLSLINQVLES